MPDFKLISEHKPQGDQPRAIAELTEGVLRGDRHQTLLGVTGSGKTFTMANVVANVQRPTLIIAHNKTLAAQLYGEFKDLFPQNAVEYMTTGAALMTASRPSCPSRAAGFPGARYAGRRGGSQPC